MSNKILLTVILPVYNAEKYIKDAIESILNQTFEDFKIIIIDDCSTDNSYEVIKTFNDKRMNVRKNEKNLGKVQTVNNIVKSIDTKYFTVHDADDLSKPNRFEEQIKFLEKNESIVMCGCSFSKIDKNSNFLQTVNMPTKLEIIKTQSFPNISNFHGPTLVIRTKLLSKVGGFYRKHFKLGEDIEFCTRVVEKFDCTNLDVELYDYRIIETSLTNNIENFDYKSRWHIEFGIYLQKIRREENKDLYIELSEDDLEILVNSYIAKARKKQSLYYKQGMDRLINFELWSNAFNLSMRWIQYDTYNLKPYKYFITLVIRYLKSRKRYGE